MTDTALTPAPDAPAMSTEKRATLEKDIITRLRRIDAEHPDPKDITWLRTLLREQPAFYNLLTRRVTTVDEALIRRTVSHEVGVQVLLAQADKMRTDLGDETAPPLERPLIAHVVTAWLTLQQAEAGYESRVGGKNGVDLDIGIWWEKRMTMIQRRYLRAVETLARVRRLTAPATVQINVGEKQINVVEQT